MKVNNRLLIVGVAVTLLCLAAGCKKRTPVAAPPAAQQQLAAPTITLTAQPPIIAEGASATLSWTTTNATGVTIETVGQFPPQGSTVVSPKASVTYVAVATGAGGTVSTQARVTVTPAPVTTTTESPRVDETDQGFTVEQIFKNEIQDVFFDFDRAEITAEYKDILRRNADVLIRRLPQVGIMIEGHCDERGTEEYNIGLGDRRANATRDYLVSLGMSATRIKTISYGEERPFDPAHNEEAWAKNRRAHFVLIKP